MKVIILGAGRVGYSLAEYLSKEGNDVTVVDPDPEKIKSVNHRLDARGMVGLVTIPKVLSKAGAEDADLLVAVTSSDETNMIACQIGYSLFDVNLRIAHIKNEAYLDKEADAKLFSTDHIPVSSVIAPEKEVANAIWHQLEFPDTKEIVPMQGADPSTTHAVLVGVSCDDECPVLSTPLRQLSVIFPNLQLTIVAIIRNNKAFSPNGDDEIEKGDIIYFAAERSHVQRGLVAFGHETERAKKLTILGGGRIGLNLAEIALKDKEIERVRVVEVDLERANYVAEKLPDCRVIHGSAMDFSMLGALRFADNEVAVAVTDSDELNVVSAGVLKNLKCKHTMALISNEGITSQLEKFQIDTIINPRTITISQILRHIRHGRIRSVHTLRDGFAELMEGEVLSASPIAGKRIQDMKLPNGVMITSILRNGNFILPRPHVTLEAGDEISVFSLADVVKDAEKVLSVRAEAF